MNSPNTISLSSTILYTFLVGLCSSTTTTNCGSSTEIFLQKNDFSKFTKHSKYSGTTRFVTPAIHMANLLSDKGYGYIIFDGAIDPHKEELMLHSYRSSEGINIYKICKKNTKYNKYGPIFRYDGQYQIAPEGFRVNITDYENFTRLLIKNTFKIYENVDSMRTKIEEEKQDQLKIKQETESILPNIFSIVLVICILNILKG